VKKAARVDLGEMINGHFFGSPLQPKSFISGKESAVVNGKRGNVIRGEQISTNVVKNQSVDHSQFNIVIPVQSVSVSTGRES
jgi:hypothetical protein